jgi:hypothetical protein
MDGGMREERVLHERFASARAEGEWFRPVPDLLAYIDSLRSVGGG